MQTLHPIIENLYHIGAIEFGEFELKSGEITSVYINLRKIISFPNLLKMISSAMWECAKDKTFDTVCGVPYTALPIATCLSLTHNIPMVMRRKEKKDYGTKQMIEGVFQPGQSCLVLEDIITSGASIIETAQELKNVGLEIAHVIALIDRNQGGIANLEKSYTVETLFNLNDLLQQLILSSIVSEKEKQLARDFLAARNIAC